MANNHLCLECGVSGVSKDLVNCVNCYSYAIHRYCMIEWPNTKHGPVYWLCGCQEQSNESELIGSGITAKDNEEEEVSIQSEEIKKENSSYTIHPKFKTGKREKIMKSFTSYGQGKHVEPIIRSIWNGSFQIRFMHDFREVNGITAFLSNKAASDETVYFRSVIETEMVMKELVWPNGFEENGPKDEDITVYFFSSLGVDEQVYDCLVFEMMRDDLAMRVDLENAEMLIFTSVDLIPRLRKFQGKWYLWGFFRQKNRSNEEDDNLSGTDLCSS